MQSAIAINVFAPQQLFIRVQEWITVRIDEQATLFINEPILAVGHAGWINATKMVDAGQEVPKLASDWQSPAYYCHCTCLSRLLFVAKG